MKHHLKEVEKALSLHPQRVSTHNPEAYIGGGQSSLRYLGLKTPNLHQTQKAGFSFSDTEEVAQVWDYVWKSSDCFEVMSLALGWFERLAKNKKRKQELKKYWALLKGWSERIDNWAHSDSLSGLYARILEQDPKLVYPTLQKWNASANPWLRRLSIVSLLYYSAQRETVLPFAKIIPLVEAQIEFDHYYVQKGVGWTLREAGNVYPKETYKFLEANIRRISPEAFTAATEKLTKTEKDRLKKLRAGR